MKESTGFQIHPELPKILSQTCVLHRSSLSARESFWQGFFLEKELKSQESCNSLYSRAC